MIHKSHSMTGLIDGDRVCTGCHICSCHDAPKRLEKQCPNTMATSDAPDDLTEANKKVEDNDVWRREYEGTHGAPDLLDARHDEGRWVDLEGREQIEAMLGIKLERWQWDYFQHLANGERLVPYGRHGSKWIRREDSDRLVSLSEDVRGHAMESGWQAHADGRLCMKHHRLNIFTPDGLNQCLRVHIKND